MFRCSVDDCDWTSDDSDLADKHVLFHTINEAEEEFIEKIADTMESLFGDIFEDEPGYTISERYFHYILEGFGQAKNYIVHY